ncbi:MAG: hypothetical protein SGJ11_16045, partial [Phycisphaerae bacterium]|nr:hypothetical protein [Phycisphaerae bacterium]
MRRSTKGWSDRLGRDWGATGARLGRDWGATGARLGRLASAVIAASLPVGGAFAQSTISHELIRLPPI